MTKEELDKKIKEGSAFHQDYLEGTKYIFPQKHKDWLKFVSVCYKDIFEGKEVKPIINVLKNLKECKDFSQIKKDVDKNFDDNVSYYRLMNAVVKFGINGPEFFEYSVGDYSYETEKYLTKQKQENREFEEQLIYGEEKNSLCIED